MTDSFTRSGSPLAGSWQTPKYGTSPDDYSVSFVMAPMPFDGPVSCKVCGAAFTADDAVYGESIDRGPWAWQHAGCKP